MSPELQDLNVILNIAAVLGVTFSIYLHFRNPQIKSEQLAVKFREEIETLKTIVSEIKEKHLFAVEQDMKKLSEIIGHLSMTVTKLSTIIDERIPKK